jgi:succinoglycan biosynthesis transport protein ExoP
MFQTVDVTESTATGASRPSAFGPIARIEFGSVFSVIWQRKLLVVGAVAASIMAMMVFIASVPPQYTATSQILVQPNELRVVERGLVAGPQVSEENVVQVESQVRVISSDNVLQRVVAGERLDKDPEFASTQPSAWRSLASRVLGGQGLGHSAAAVDPSLAALNELRRRLRVKRAERTYVVDISLPASTAAKAVRIVTAISDAYLAELTAAKSDAARRVSDSLQSRLSELKERVRNAEERVEEFKSRHDIVDASGTTVNEQQLTELNNQVSRARNRTAEAKARSEQVQSLLKSGGNVAAIPEAIQSATIASLRAQYAEVTRREADLTTQLGQRHPFVADIQAQVQGVRRLINEELNRIAEAARNDYLREQANEAALSQKLEVLKRSTMTTNEALVTLRELQRDVQTNRALYESFLARSRETGELKGLDTNNVRVISTGEPLRRSWPPGNMVLMVGALAFGLVAGAGVAMVRGPVGSRATAARPVQKLPDAAILAELPRDGDTVALTASSAPRSRFAAEIRRLYAALGASNPGRSVLIVTPCEDVNAAKVAVNLASIVAPNRKVLLIDGDIRQGTISAIYQQPIAFGLVDVAAGQVSLADAVICDSRTKIDLIPLISSSSRLSNRLNLQGMQRAFDQAKNYDFIIVSATIRDRELGASLFSMLVDNIVVVVKAGAPPTTLEEVHSAVGIEARKIRGTVVTDTVAAAA